MSKNEIDRLWFPSHARQPNVAFTYSKRWLSQLPAFVLDPEL